MLIQMMPIDAITPYPGNPRRNDEAVDAVAASIREFGFVSRVVVDDDDVIIVGHTRYKAARKLGLTELPVHVAVGCRNRSPDSTECWGWPAFAVGGEAVAQVLQRVPVL